MLINLIWYELEIFKVTLSFAIIAEKGIGYDHRRDV